MEGARPVRAPRGTTLTAQVVGHRGPAADADEQPRPRERRAPRRPRRLRRHRPGRPRLAVLRRDGPHPDHPGGRRDDARPVRPAGRRACGPTSGRRGCSSPTPTSSPRLGHLAGVPPAGAARPDHVRPDDRRLVDLHRHPGHRPGHLRDVRRRRREAVRRHAGRDPHPDRRLRRHGRRPAAGRHPQRRRLPDRRRRPRPAATAGSSTATSTRSPTTSTTRSRRRCGAKANRRAWSVGVVGNCAEVFPELLRRGVRDRRRHRPDRGARPAVLPARGGRVDDWADYAERKPEEFTDRAREPRWPGTCRPWSSSRTPGAEVFDYGNSIRDEARQGGYERAFDFPGFVPAYIRPLFCEGKGPFRWVALSGRPEGHRRHRPGRDGPVPRQRPAAEVDARRPRADRLPGPAGPDLLARATASGTGPGWRSTTWSPAARSARRSSSAATTSTAARSPAPTARPSRCSTAPTRSPTGRCSTPWSTPPPARPGCRSTTAAASASAARSTPARSRSPTAPPLAAQKLARVLTNDPGMGVIRHVDAGYDLPPMRGRRRARGRRGSRCDGARPDPSATATP